VALVHDWLTGMRGGERVLEELVGLFPDADVFTLVHVPGATSAVIDARPIRTSFLSRIPGIGRHYRMWLPLFPTAIERLDLSGYDRVVSCSHAVAKGVRTPDRAHHVCYCLTPMRYVWDQQQAYLGRGVKRLAAAPLTAYLRRFDRRTSSCERVDRFVSISTAVQERIARHYGRESRIVHPPVATDRIRPSGADPQDFDLLVGGFVPYKREDVAIEAFRRLGRRLVVAGDGPGRRRLAAGAPENVVFVGRVSDSELTRLYADCRALVHPQDEDFGIAAVEAQAAGRPVIALGRGGARDTVRPLGGAGATPTGIWFDDQNPGSLEQAVHVFEKQEAEFDPQAIRRWAEGFSRERFRREILAEIEA
jgi:glycosyltransferase involved in cell wall biosynthesis